jgi:diguanylate cyclase (GGDEF)-like protein
MPKPAPTFRFSRMSLVHKIGAGYLAMALFTSAALFFSSMNMHASIKMAGEIASHDLPVINALIRLRSSLLGQESFAAKYAILRDRSFIDLYHEREKDTLAELSVLERTAPANELAPLEQLYVEYQREAEQLFRGGSADTARVRSAAATLLDGVDALYEKRQEMLQQVVKQGSQQQRKAFTGNIVLAVTGFIIALLVAPFVTWRTFRAIRELQSATHRIAAGDFDVVPTIQGRDEISELAGDFSKMAARLKVLEQMNLDASPLTRLPGNIVIERELEERLKSGAHFAFCYADLDNFKPFSDHYGYSKGSDLLRVTGDLISAAVSSYAGPDGFVGHVGGDDFVMVVPTDRAATVCEEVITSFDAEAVKHFSPEDREAGGIEGTDRYGVRRFFPITSISIAVIFCGGGHYRSAVDIARAAARVKDAAKGTPGSSYLISRQEHVV